MVLRCFFSWFSATGTSYQKHIDYSLALEPLCMYELLYLQGFLKHTDSHITSKKKKNYFLESKLCKESKCSETIR